MQPNTTTEALPCRRQKDPNRVPFTVVLPRPVWLRLRAFSRDQGTSMQFLIEQAVKRYFEGLTAEPVEKGA
jgi:hypothetical protein